MGFVSNQLNQLPIDMNGNVLGTDQPSGISVGIGSGGLPPADGLPNGANPQDAATEGQGTWMLPPGSGTPGGGKAPFTTPGGSAPGMGGKGPVSGAMLDPNGPQGNLPQPQTPNFVGVQQGGTPGRPVPAAPMTPRGPGFANPGAPGVNPQSPQDRPLTGNFQPVAPARGGRPTPQAIREQAQAVGLPVGNLSPQPLGRPPVTGTINKPNRGIGTHYGPIVRGAGRGGILR